MPSQPAAFMSYSLFDDKHHNGFLTAFRKRLSNEVRAQWGHKFKIFQDVADIDWGSNWKQRLDEALESATFLIPIITPSFFASKACRAEVMEFDTHEQRLQHGGLILPVYYIETPQFEKYEQYKQDPVVATLYRCQYTDWRKLRYEHIKNIEVKKKISALAGQITRIIRLSSDERPGSGSSPVASDAGEPVPGRASREADIQLNQGLPIGTPSQEDEGQEPGHAALSGKLATGILRAVPSPEISADPWSKLLDVLRQTKFEPVEWQLFSVRTQKIRGILSQDFPPYPAKAEEVSSVIEALASAVGSAATEGTTMAQIRSSCEAAERLRVILIDLITKMR